jgi:hypothetical protein
MTVSKSNAPAAALAPWWLEMTSRVAIPYFFRSRFALAVAPWSHGAISEAIDAWPKLDISVSPVDIAAAAFSVTMRW